MANVVIHLKEVFQDVHNVQKTNTLVFTEYYREIYEVLLIYSTIMILPLLVYLFFCMDNKVSFVSLRQIFQNDSMNIEWNLNPRQK